jgi:hypothetical protein
MGKRFFVKVDKTRIKPARDSSGFGALKFIFRIKSF